MFRSSEQVCPPMSSDQQLTVSALVAALGGAARVAALCGVTGSAVSNWCAEHHIPARHWLKLWRAARAAGIAWAPPGADGLEIIERAPEARAAAVAS